MFVAAVCFRDTDNNGNAWPEITHGKIHKNNTLCRNGSTGNIVHINDFSCSFTSVYCAYINVKLFTMCCFPVIQVMSIGDVFTETIRPRCITVLGET